MTKIAENPIARYEGNDATASFDTTFEVFELADIVVELLDDSRQPVTIALDGGEATDYSLTGVYDGTSNRYTEAQVVFNHPLPANYLLGITRRIDQIQDLDLTAGGALPAEALERKLDRAVAMVQDVQSQIDRAAKTRIGSPQIIELGGQRITGLLAPENDSDAATRAWVRDQLVTTGIQGEQGPAGTPGESPTVYQIRAQQTALRNGVGTITVEAISINPNTGVQVVNSGSIQLYVGTALVTTGNGYAAGSDGYTGVFDSGDINGSLEVTLRNGLTGDVYDTITLVDVADGSTSNATYGSAVSPTGLNWVKSSAGVWAPAQLTHTLTGTFYQNGAAVSQGVCLATLDETTGLITLSEVSSDATVNLTFINNGTASPTVEFEETDRNAVFQESFVAVQDGEDGANGAPGANGASATVYKLVPTNGTAIKNGVGTLTVEARVVTGVSETLLASGTIRIYDPSNNEVTVANGYATGSDGFTAVLDAGDIDDSIVLTMKDGPGGTPLDTIALADIADGIASNATTGWVEVSNGRSWRRAENAGAWTPAQTFTDVTGKFAQGGSVIAQETRRVNLDQSGGTLTSALSGSNDPDITVAISGSGTGALTVTFTHGPSGAQVSETISTVVSGQDGTPGVPGAPGQDAIQVSYTVSNGLSSVQNSAGAWTPSAATTDINFTFTQGGTVIASRLVRATRNNANGNQTLTFGSVVGEATSVLFENNATLAASATVTHAGSGVQATITVTSVLSGSNGVSQISIERNSEENGNEFDNGSSAVVHTSQGGSIEVNVNASGFGTWTGSPPSGATLRLFENGTVIATVDVSLENTQEDIGEGGGSLNFWTSNPNLMTIKRFRTPGAGNVTYSTTWSAGATNRFFTGPAGSNRVKINTRETAAQ